MVKSSPKLVENTVGIGEIAYYGQFLHSPQFFQKTCRYHSDPEDSYASIPLLTLSQTTIFRTSPKRKSLQKTILDLMKMAESSPKWVENTVGKGEIAR